MLTEKKLSDDGENNTAVASVGSNKNIAKIKYAKNILQKKKSKTLKTSFTYKIIAVHCVPKKLCKIVFVRTSSNVYQL